MRLKLLLLLTFCSPAALYAQSTEADLKARLIHQPLYLREFWGENSLQYDSSGHLASGSDRVSFTLCGVDVTKIHLTNTGLALDAKRVGLELKGKTPKRVVLRVGEANDLKDEVMHLAISSPQNGDYKDTLDAIFATSLADLTPSLPQYWQTYAQQAFLSANAPSPAPASTSPVNATKVDPAKRVGGTVKPPDLLQPMNPEFTEAAHNLKYPAKVVIQLIVEKDGTPSHLEVIKPAGLGLDEASLEAVHNYLFRPATENGVAIRVQLAVEVAFDIY